MRGYDGTPQSRIGFLACACVVCGKIGWPHQVGSECKYCGVGAYLRHGLFVMNLCPTCLGKGIGCKSCTGRGVLPSPSEDITHEQAAAEWAEIEAQKAESPTPLFRPETQPWVGKRTKRSRKARR